MRSIQRGIATSIILAILLVVGVAIASAYFIFYQNQQKLKLITSFEDCAKYYPVMESYPQQCNTPDGKHYVQELSKEEKQKLIPPMQQCTKEALICPDGSSVGRTGPNCEFAPCPSE